MTCERWREAISARLDGEELGVDERLLDRHLARCVDCRRYARETGSSRRLRVRPVGAVPDLGRRVSAAVSAADRGARSSAVLAVLAAVALVIVVLSIRTLVLGDGQDTSTHAARHLGAFTVAYGVGLLVVVLRPARARTMLPVAVVLTGALAVTAVVDLVERRIPLVGEAQHVPELLSVVLVWLIAVRGDPTRHRRIA